MEKLSVKECISFGWRTFTARPWFFVLVPFVIFAAAFVVAFVQGIVVLIAGKTIGGFLSFLISVALNIFIGMAAITLYLKAHDNVSSVRLKDLWNPKPFWKFLGVAILQIVIVCIGLILLIVPGIIASLALYFATYIVVDREMNPIAAIKESMRITKGHRWSLFLLMLALVVINLVGMLALFVGIFVSLPVSLFAVVHAYKTLSSRAGTVPAPAPAAV